MVADDNSQVILNQGLNVVHTSKSTKAFTIFLNKGTNITLKWVKLEQGKVATEFIAPNYAEEILKCQRFYVVLESSLAGYGANSAKYIPFARGVYMRNSRNVIFTGANKQTFLRVNGTGKQISFNTTNGYANNQYLRVYTNPVDTSLNNTAIGIDLNDTTISVDAEIYYEEAMNNEYKVYVSLQDGYITSINSDIFLSEEEMSTMTEVDKGQGDKYAHAQSQYLDKELVDELGRYNYKFLEGKVVEVAEAEKPTIKEPEQQATAQDKIEAQVMYTAMMTDTLLEESEA